VWYSWLAPSSGVVNVKAAVTTADSDIEPLQGYVELGANLSLGHILASGVITPGPVQFYAVAGQTYHLCIDTYVPGYINYNGYPFQFTLAEGTSIPADSKLVPPLSNVNFASPYVITGASADLVLFTGSPTFDPLGEEILQELKADVAGFGYDPSGAGGVWVSWTAVTTGTAHFDAQTPSGNSVTLVSGSGNGSTLDLTDYAYSYGPSINSLTFPCRKGTVYYFYVLSQNDYSVLANFSSVSSSSSGGGGSTPSTFAEQAGVFTGLIGNSGLVTVTTTKTGSFTGKVIISGVTHPLTGVFSSKGDFVGVTGNPAIQIAMHLDLTQTAPEIGAYMLTGTAASTPFSAYHSTYEAGHLGASRKYTLLFGPTISGPSIPQGTGYATATVGTLGGVAITGALADGTPLSASGLLMGPANSAQLPIFDTALYSSKGRLAGTIIFQHLTNSDCNGALQWIKPKLATGSYYKAGFDTTLATAGALYVPPKAGSMALDFKAALNNAVITLNNGGVSPSITKTATLTTANTILVSAPNSQAVKMTISAATSAMSGTFIHPVSHVVTPFHGVLFQNTNVPRAAGFFLGPVVSGTGLSGGVTLTP
jgi:hypothetical protein